MDNLERKDKLAERTIYFDFLRVFATIAVIILHVAAQNFYKVDVMSFEWQIFNVVDSLMRWAVPIFVMISGALFLDNKKKITIGKLYKNNVLRILTALIFWSAVYACNRIVHGANIKTAISYFIKGQNHLWFLYMLIGIYISIPVLRKIVESKELTKYFLLISFVFTFFLPRVINLVKCMEIPYTTVIVDSINSAISNMNFHFVLGFTFYFVLGYYLKENEIGKSYKYLGEILFLTGFMLTVILTLWYSVKTDEPNTTFYSNFSVNVLMMAVGLFLFAKNRFNDKVVSQQGKRIIHYLSNYTFGMYLVHILVLDLIKIHLNINTLTYNPICSIIVLVLAVTIISFVISFLLNHIPVLKKYIV